MQFKIRGYEPLAFPAEFDFNADSRNHLRMMYKTGRQEGFAREVVRGIITGMVLGALLYHRQVLEEAIAAVESGAMIVAFNANEMDELTPSERERLWEMDAHRNMPTDDDVYYTSPPPPYATWDEYYDDRF